MNRTHSMGRRGLSVLVVAAIALLGDRCRAQSSPQVLDELLALLHGTPAAAWQERADAMQERIAAAKKSAATLRKQAADKAKAAAGESQAAERLRQEIKKLEQLQSALAKLEFRDPAGSAKKVTTGRGQLEVALGTLRDLPSSAWQERIEAVSRRIAAHESAAKELEAAGMGLIAKADGMTKQADALAAEIGKLEQLRKLVATISPELVAVTKPAAKPAEEPAKKPEEPAKKPAKKPAAKPPEKPAIKADAKAKKAMPDDGKDGAMPAPATTSQSAASDGPDDFVTYDDHMVPIFEAHCYDCHDSGDPSGGLDLTSFATTLQGGGSGRTLRPGSPDESRLFLLVAHRETPVMPRGEPKLAREKIERIRAWIEQGAPKDKVQAASKKKERAIAAKRAAAEAAARKAAAVPVQAVMPGELPKVRKAYPARPGALRAVAAAPGAPLLAVSGLGQVLLLHQEQLRELGVLEFPFGQIATLEFSLDGTALLATGGVPADGGGAVLFDVATGRELGRFAKQRGAAMAGAVAPRADLVAIGGPRKRIEVFSVDDGEEIWRQDHEDWVTAAAFSPDGKLLATADRQGFVQVREARTGREVHSMKAGDGLLADLAFSPDNAMLATVTADRALCLYRMSDGRRLQQKRDHRDAVLCLAWRGKSRLLTSGADGRVFHWRTNGRREKELPRIDEWVYDLALSADGKAAFTADWQGRLTAIDIESRKIVQQISPLLVSQ